MEKFLIFGHVAGGGTVLLLGLLNFLMKKGSNTHRLIGKIYVGAMWWICLSALLLISFYRFSFFLLVISVITFYASFVGIRVLHRKQAGAVRWYDWVVAGATALFGIGLFVYGVYVFFPFSRFSVLGTLSLIFGFFTFRTGWVDLVFFQKGTPTDPKWWLRQHINAISGSYVAAITAFAVQNSAVFIPDQSWRWLAWILPTLIATPLISRMQKKYVGAKAKTQLREAITS